MNFPYLLERFTNYNLTAGLQCSDLKAERASIMTENLISQSGQRIGSIAIIHEG